MPVIIPNLIQDFRCVDFKKLKFHGARSGAEGIERSGCVLEIERFGVVVVGGVHRLELGVVFEHVDLRFAAVVADECSGDADPFVTGLVHGTDFDLAVLLDLLGAVLRLASLDIELALKNVGGTERANTRLVTVYRCQKVGAAFLEKFYDFFHENLPFLKQFIPDLLRHFYLD